MNKLWLSLTVVTMVLAAFAGCAKKGDDGNNTPVGSLDESLVYDSSIADTGYRVAGGLSGTATALNAGANGSAASLKVNDIAADDSEGAQDKADFLVDAKEADGSRLQAELRSMTTANDSGVQGDFFGGVLHNQEINGDSGIGYPDLPKTKAYILLQGLARVKYNDATLEDLQLVQVAVIKGIRGPDQAALSAPEEDLEVHVLFPGSLIPGNDAFPDVGDGFMYFYFENVKLEQASPEDKGLIGSRLQAPARPNVPPVATAVVRLENGTQVSSAEFDPDLKFLNVTLDASASSDSDGRIEAFSWDVKEFNSTGSLVPLNKTSGATANFSFTSGGTKIIDLRIIDEDGGISNTTLFFFVNTKKVYAFTFGANTPPLDGAGAGTSCQPALNCKDHSVTVFYGAKRLTSTPIANSQTCNTPRQTLYDPNGDQVASANGLNVAAEDLTAVGKYKLDVWFTSQARCSYSFTVSVSYAPDAATGETA